MANLIKILCLTVISTVAPGGWCFSVTEENIESKLRILSPALMMAEDIFRLEDTNSCFKKMFCLLETTEKAIESDNPLKHFSRFLTNSLNDFDEIAAEKFTSLVQKFPYFSKVVDAIVTGKIANDSRACHMNFGACKAEEEQLVGMASEIITRMTSSVEDRQLSKRDCNHAGLACGVVGAGCLLCTAATEGICGAACAPEVAAACAGIDIGCAIGSLFG